MLKSRNEFITRQLQSFDALPDSERADKFKQLLTNTLDTTEAREASNYFDSHQSIAKTMDRFGLSAIKEDILKKIIEIEEKQQTRVPLSDLSKLSKLSSQVFSLLKLRLNAGLTYALTLTLMAAVVFHIVTSNVLVQFEEVFASFGAQLPELTLWAIAWQKSYFPPVILTIILTVFILFLLIQTKKIDSTKESSILKRLPILSRVFQFIQSFAYLSELKIYAASGIGLQQIFQIIDEPPSSLKKMSQYTMDEIRMADELGNLNQEIDYQIDSLALKAENIVLSATRALITGIMTLVVIFVGFVIIASYLPLFQMGAVV